MDPLSGRRLWEPGTRRVHKQRGSSGPVGTGSVGTRTQRVDEECVNCGRGIWELWTQRVGDPRSLRVNRECRNRGPTECMGSVGNQGPGVDGECGNWGHNEGKGRHKLK